MSALDGAAGAVQKVRAAAGRAHWTWRWLPWIVLVLLVLVGIVIAWRRMADDRAELARLRHQEELRRDEAAQALADAQAAGHKEAADAAAARAREAVEEARRLRDQIDDVEERAAANRRKAEAITWSDLPRGEP